MVKEDIIAGLKSAVSRGESLENAMMSFFNSGYLRQDIEEAAISMRAPQLPSQTTIIPQQETKTSFVPIPPKIISTAKIQQTPVQEKTSEPIQQKVSPETTKQEPKVVQKVSDYFKKSSKMNSALIFSLVFFLLILIGSLVATFIFKEQASAFLNKIFG